MYLQTAMARCAPPPHLHKQPNGFNLDKAKTIYKMTKKEPRQLTNKLKKLKMDVNINKSNKNETMPMAAFSNWAPCPRNLRNCWSWCRCPVPQEKLQEVRAGPNTPQLTKKPRLDTKATTYTQATVTKNKAKMRPKGSTNLDTTPAPGPK